MERARRYKLLGGGLHADQTLETTVSVNPNCHELLGDGLRVDRAQQLPSVMPARGQCCARMACQGIYLNADALKGRLLMCAESFMLIPF